MTMPTPERLDPVGQCRGEVPRWRVWCAFCGEPRIISAWPGAVRTKHKGCLECIDPARRAARKARAA